MANRTTLEAERPVKSKATKRATNGTPASPNRERIFDAFRRWGYLEASLDPLGFLEPLKSRDLDFSGPDTDAARAIYSASIGADFMHLLQPERRRWIAKRMESPGPETDRDVILTRLVRADLFEQVLQSRYLGTKRFSLEGVTSLIPLLDSILDATGEHGAVESVVAMSHRRSLCWPRDFRGNAELRRSHGLRRWWHHPDHREQFNWVHPAARAGTLVPLRRRSRQAPKRAHFSCKCRGP